MVQLSATRYSCMAILWVSLVSFAAITLCVASQRVIPKVSIYFFINSFRKLLDTSSYSIFIRRWRDEYVKREQAWDNTTMSVYLKRSGAIRMYKFTVFLANYNILCTAAPNKWSTRFSAFSNFFLYSLRVSHPHPPPLVLSLIILTCSTCCNILIQTNFISVTFHVLY
jgi:hypothetical protein